jgi:hypothetical protein
MLWTYGGSKIRPGYRVGKGAELGYFQYGGSTHCLVFRPGAIAEFALAAIPQPHDPKAPLMLVRSKLAIARAVRLQTPQSRIGTPGHEESRHPRRGAGSA